MRTAIKTFTLFLKIHRIKSRGEKSGIFGKGVISKNCAMRSGWRTETMG